MPETVGVLIRLLCYFSQVHVLAKESLIGCYPRNLTMDHENELIDLTEDSEENVLIIIDDDDEEDTSVTDNNKDLIESDRYVSDNEYSEMTVAEDGTKDRRESDYYASDCNEMMATEEMADELNIDKYESQIAVTYVRNIFVTSVDTTTQDIDDGFSAVDKNKPENIADAFNIDEMDDILYKSMREIAKFDPAFYPDLEYENNTRTHIDKQNIRTNVNKLQSTGQAKARGLLPIGMPDNGAIGETFEAPLNKATTSTDFSETKNNKNEKSMFDISSAPNVGQAISTMKKNDNTSEMKTKEKVIDSDSIAAAEVSLNKSMRASEMNWEISTLEKGTSKTLFEYDVMQMNERQQNTIGDKTTLDNKANDETDNTNKDKNITRLFTPEELAVCMPADNYKERIKEHVKERIGHKGEATGTKSHKAMTGNRFKRHRNRHNSVSSKRRKINWLADEVKTRLLLKLNNSNINDQFIDNLALFQRFKAELAKMDLCDLHSNVERLEFVRGLIREILRTYENRAHSRFHTNIFSEPCIRTNVYPGLSRGPDTFQGAMPDYSQFSPVLQSPVNVKPNEGAEFAGYAPHCDSWLNGHKCYVNPQQMHTSQNVFSAPPLFHQRYKCNQVHSPNFSNGVANAQSLRHTSTFGDVHTGQHLC